MTGSRTPDGIRPEDVAAALRGLEPGPYLPRELYERYIEAARAAGRAGGYPRDLGRVLNGLGIERPRYYPDRGAPARMIDPAALAARWPDLPWSD